MNFIKYEESEGIGLLTIHRPEALNALNSVLLEELDQKIRDLTGLKCLIVTGAGEKAFVAGADIKEMEDLSPDQAKAMAERGQRVFQSLSDLPFPVIAAVNGFALGGGLELALACDFILASEKAKMGLPEVGLGLIPGYGGTQRLARLVGPNVASQMVYSGDIFTATQCQAWNLVNEVVPGDQLISRCQELAKGISKKGPVAVGLAKSCLKKGLDLSLARGLDLEAEGFSRSFASEDHLEGIKAFMEKRAPKFKGQ